MQPLHEAESDPIIFHPLLQKVNKKVYLESEQEYSLRSQKVGLSGIQHPNILEMIDLFRDENFIWYPVVEFCPGGVLYHAIESG